VSARPADPRWRRASNGWWILEGTSIGVLQAAGFWHAGSWQTDRESDAARRWLIENHLWRVHLPSLVAARRQITAAHALDPAPPATAPVASLRKVTAGLYTAGDDESFTVQAKVGGGWAVSRAGQQLAGSDTLLDAAILIGRAQRIDMIPEEYL